MPAKKGELKTVFTTKEVQTPSYKKVVMFGIAYWINWLNNLTIDEKQQLQNENCYNNSQINNAHITMAALDAGLGKYSVGFGYAYTANITAKNYNPQTKKGYQRSGEIILGAVTEEQKKFKPSKQYMEQVYKILKNFDLSHMAPVQLVYDPETKELSIFDGLHRLICMLMLGVKLIPASFVTGVSDIEAAERFANQYENCFRLNNSQKFVAKLVANENGCEQVVDAVCADKGITIMQSPTVKLNVVNHFETPTEIADKWGEEGLGYVLDFIKECWPNDEKRLQARFMRVAELAFLYTRSPMKENVNILKNMIKSFKTCDNFVEYCITTVASSNAPILSDKAGAKSMLRIAEEVLTATNA